MSNNDNIVSICRILRARENGYDNKRKINNTTFYKNAAILAEDILLSSNPLENVRRCFTINDLRSHEIVIN